MAIDPSIPLQAQSPLEMLARFQAIRNQQQQYQLGQQQLQQGQIQLNGQRALDQAMQTAFTKGPDGNLQINREGVVNSLTSRGAGHLVPGVLDNFNKMDKAAADLKEQQLKTKSAADDYAANSLMTIYDAKFDPSIAIGTLAHARASGALPPDQAQQMADQITANPTPETVQGLIQPLLDRSPGFQKLVDSRKTAQAATDRASAATTEAGVATQRLNAELPGITANSTVAAAKADAIKAFKANPQSALDQVDQILPPNAPGNADVNRAYKTLVQSAMARGDFETVKNTLDHAGEYVAGIARETNPQVMAARTRQAVANAQATAPIEIKKAVDQQIAIAKNSPDAFAGVTNPRSVAAAGSAYKRDSDEYVTKAGAAQQLADFISAAQSGNKAAPGLIPIADVRTLVNRVNSQELKAVSTGAGSLLDRVQGKLSSLKSGQPIPPDVLADMKQLSGVMQQEAARTYQYKVEVTNKTYGSKLQPIALPGAGSAASTPALQVGQAVSVRGKQMKVTAVHPDGSFDAQ